jgi:hypothetical protein
MGIDFYLKKGYSQCIDLPGQAEQIEIWVVCTHAKWRLSALGKQVLDRVCLEGTSK